MLWKDKIKEQQKWLEKMETKWENTAIIQDHKRGMEREHFQEIVFKTEYSEFMAWLCRERETEPEMKLWFPAQVAEQMQCLLKE